MGNENISLANSSLLKHHKSSIDPPPLERITTSISFPEFSLLNLIILFKAFIIDICASSP